MSSNHRDPNQSISRRSLVQSANAICSRGAAATPTHVLSDSTPSSGAAAARANTTTRHRHTGFPSQAFRPPQAATDLKMECSTALPVLLAAFATVLRRRLRPVALATATAAARSARAAASPVPRECEGDGRLACGSVMRWVSRTRYTDASSKASYSGLPQSHGESAGGSGGCCCFSSSSANSRRSTPISNSRVTRHGILTITSAALPLPTLLYRPRSRRIKREISKMN